MLETAQTNNAGAIPPKISPAEQFDAASQMYQQQKRAKNNGYKSGYGKRLAGTGLRAGGTGAQAAGKGLTSTGQAMMRGGAALAGAVPVAGHIVGGAMIGAGALTTGLGYGAQAVGRGARLAGRATQIKAGTQLDKDRITALREKASLKNVQAETGEQEDQSLLKKFSAKALKHSWLQLIPSFGLTVLYLNLHFALAYLGGLTRHFPRFGHEWTQGSIVANVGTAMGGLKGNLLKKSQSIISKAIEVLEIALLQIINLFIILVFLVIVSMLFIMLEPFLIAGSLIE